MDYQAFLKKTKTKQFIDNYKSNFKEDVIKKCSCDSVIYNIVSKYYKNPTDENKELVDIKDRKKLDLKLAKVGIKKKKITLEEAKNYNSISFGNLNFIIEHCPTKSLVKIAENHIDQVLNFLIDSSIELQYSKLTLNKKTPGKKFPSKKK
jgi:agmatine/peptidylarginine deiminase